MRELTDLERFEIRYPVRRAFHTGQWGWRRAFNCLDRRQATHATEAAAEADRRLAFVEGGERVY